MTISANEIRRSFLTYFEQHGHRVVPSSPLVPHDDPTLLFTNAGMNQFKDVLLGRETRDYNRAATVQKCMRVSGKHNDLENVGPSLRHHTFFEMLGNFSFGDYFKKDAIELAWTLLTDVWKMPPDRFVVSIFKGDGAIPRDDEAHDIWRRFVPADRIMELGADDNFWSMGETGPCGRSSEIYFVRGTGQDPEIEIWNNVFMEFDRQADGTLNPLPARSIDTGMGLERITAVLQGYQSNYGTDLFMPLLLGIATHAKAFPSVTKADKLEALLANDQSDAAISIRVVADHLRAMTFLIADGVTPSNEWRGYVLRKIMRRAMRHGKRLGVEEPFLHTMIDDVIRLFGDSYPELSGTRETIKDIVRNEEDRFDSVLNNALPKLEAVLTVAEVDGTTVSGEDVFKLYDSFGLPFDFIEDIAASRRVPIDRNGFERLLNEQKKRAQERSAFRVGGSDLQWDFSWELGDRLSELGDKFAGYDTTRVETRIAGVFTNEGKEAPFLDTNEEGFIALAESPFYIESGGQISDQGHIFTNNDDAVVTAITKLKGHNWPRLHRVRVARGKLREGDAVVAEVTKDIRDATRRNHTATHLLHAALRAILGTHVRQAGSLVTPDRLRFDFSHSGPIARDQLIQIESLVNEQILQNKPVDTKTKPTQEAIASGAMAFFGEKYADTVRVVSVPGFSVELCGGTHVSATGDIGLFSIVSESGVAAGVRRIEAVTGMAAVERSQLQTDLLDALTVAITSGVEPPSIATLYSIGGNQAPGHQTLSRAKQGIDAAIKLHAERKRVDRENQQLRLQTALGGGATGAAADDTIDVAGVTVVVREVSGLDKDGLRALVDQQRSRIKSGIVILAQSLEGKVSVVVGVTPDLIDKLPAGDIVKQIAPIVGGGGGGRADFAEAGGKDPSKIARLLSLAPDVIESRQPDETMDPVMPPTAPWGPQAITAVRRWLESKGTVTDDAKTGYMVVKRQDGAPINVEVRLIHNPSMAEPKMRRAVHGAETRHATPYMLVLVARVARPVGIIKPLLEDALRATPLKRDDVTVHIGFLEDDKTYSSQGQLWPR